MPDSQLVARSIAEAHLYLMVTPCAACNQGPLRGGGGEWHRGRDGEAVLSMSVECAACRATTTQTFTLPNEDDADVGTEGSVINPTDEPSHIIDVAQWLTLFRMLTEAAGKEPDKIRARQFGIEAAQCLEEALKFYDEADNDLPPPEALFHASSREHFEKNPEHFSRQRLINLRSKLPSRSVSQTRRSKGGKGRWWKR